MPVKSLAVIERETRLSEHDSHFLCSQTSVCVLRLLFVDGNGFNTALGGCGTCEKLDLTLSLEPAENHSMR